MNKKILIIEGSNRTNSFTNSLSEYFAKCFENTEIEVFNTYKNRFEFCDGCNYCEKNEKCKYRDLDRFFKSFEECDVIVFSSPVYNGTFSSPVKALLDRFQHYYTYFYKHNKASAILKSRKAVLIASSGRGGENSISYMKTQLKFALSVLNAELVDTILLNNTDYSYDEEKAKTEIQKTAERIKHL